MRIRTAVISFLVLASVIVAGCSHKVVAIGGDNQVSIYKDEDAYKQLEKMKGQGGFAGMVGGMGEAALAGKLDNNTPVKILSSDELGSWVEVSQGPSKGTKGFVPKANVD
jgi:hypothetical protein